MLQASLSLEYGVDPKIDVGLGVASGGSPGPGSGGGGGVGGVGGGGGSFSNKVNVVVVVVSPTGKTNCLILKDNPLSAIKVELFSLADVGELNPPPVV